MHRYPGESDGLELERRLDRDNHHEPCRIRPARRLTDEAVTERMRIRFGWAFVTSPTEAE